MTRHWPTKTLFVLTILVTLALAIGMIAAANEGVLSLNVGGEDYSDSWLAWVVAFPIMVVVCVLALLVTLLALGGSLVLVVACLAMAAVLAVCGILMGIAPVLAFLAVPVLAIYGFVKLIQRKPRAAPAMLANG